MRRAKRFTYEQDADFRIGNDSDWLHTIASRVEGQKILVRGQNLGSKTLAVLIAELLTVTEKVYCGERTPISCGVAVRVCYQGIIITAQALLNYDQSDSPSGFEWGHMGAGPYSLALSILEDHFVHRETAERYAKPFEEQVIATLHHDNFRITSGQIDDWAFRYEERMADASRELRDLEQEAGRP